MARIDETIDIEVQYGNLKTLNSLSSIEITNCNTSIVIVVAKIIGTLVAPIKEI